VNETLPVAEEKAAVPAAFTLSQNYPNPFNPSTEITFAVPVASPVRLEVFDVLGRHVSTLVNELKQVGEHSVSFDASNLATGMYVYRLTAGDQVLAKKMMILK
jgi:hypothetical protein